jgi:hypothetical protein
MRPMILASALVPALLLAGCSSDDNSNPSYTPFDSGTVSVPDAGSGFHAVSITVNGSGKGTVVSADGVQTDTGTFVGPDGGAPGVDCTSGATTGCSASQGTVVYATPTAGSVFVGWIDGDAGAQVSTDPNFTIDDSTSSPLIATFALVPDAGGI